MEFFRLCLHWQCGIHGYGEPHHNIATVAFFLDVIEEIYNKDASLFIHLKEIFIYLVRMVETGGSHYLEVGREVLYIDSA